MQLLNLLAWLLSVALCARQLPPPQLLFLVFTFFTLLCQNKKLQPVQLLSLLPRAYLMPKFLDKARCQHVIDMATKRLAPSGESSGKRLSKRVHLCASTSSTWRPSAWRPAVGGCGLSSG